MSLQTLRTTTALFCSVFLLLLFASVSVRTASAQQQQISTSAPVPPYEGMLCQYGRECDSSTTLMKCLSLYRGPYQCRCEPLRAGLNIVTQPYYNQGIGKCVIRVNQTCALPGGGGGWEEYNCEPNAECTRMPDEQHQQQQVRDQDRYGLCAGAAGVVAHALMLASISTLVCFMNKPY